MPLFADYEGLGVAVGLALCTAIMIPAFLLGVGGLVAATANPPWRKTACVLTVVGMLLTTLALAAALGAYWEERNHLDSHGNHFRPSPMLWITTAISFGVSLFGFAYSFGRKKPVDQTPPSI